MGMGMAMNAYFFMCAKIPIGWLDANASQLNTVASHLTAQRTFWYVNIKVSKGVDIMDFLRDNRTVLRKIFSLAGRILCIAASSVASERVFGAAGRLLEKRRTTVRTWHGHETAWTAYNFWTAICDISLYVEDNMTLTVADSGLRFWNWDTLAFDFERFAFW